MTPMTIEDVLTAIATRLKDIPELHDRVFWPQPNSITTSPTAIVINGAPQLGPSAIDRKVDVQEWRPNFTVRVLVDTNGEAPRERALLVRYLSLIVDALHHGAHGINLARLFPSLPRPLKSLTYQNYLEGEVQYNASQKCYALDVYFTASFERQPALIPLGGTP